MTCKNGLSQAWNEEAWVAKIIFIFSTFIGLFFISNHIIVYFAKFAVYLGFLFILFQIIMCIDLCYTWGEKWIA